MPEILRRCRLRCLPWRRNASYAGFGAALGLGGPEICGAPPDHGARWRLWLPALGAGCAAAVFLRRTVSKFRRTAILP